MQSDERVARYARDAKRKKTHNLQQKNAQFTKCVKPRSLGASRFDLDSDLAPSADSEKSSLAMSPILTACTRINLEGLDDKGW
jgi:hypothetical protein